MTKMNMILGVVVVVSMVVVIGFVEVAVCSINGGDCNGGGDVRSVIAYVGGGDDGRDGGGGDGSNNDGGGGDGSNNDEGMVVVPIVEFGG